MPNKFVVESLETLALSQLYGIRHINGNVTYIVNGDDRPIEIKAHRAALANASQKYKAQFSQKWGQEDNFRINVTIDTFNAFIELIYLKDKRIGKLNTQNIESVLELARYNMANDVIATCVQFMYLNHTENIVHWYNLAVHFELAEVQKFCKNTIIQNFKLIRIKNEAEHCSVETLCEMLDLEIECNEIDIFHSCIEWAKFKCTHERNIELNSKNLRITSGPVLTKIRFCSMSTIQIRNIWKEYPDLLTKKELLAAIDEIVDNEVAQDKLPSKKYEIQEIIMERV